MLGWVSLKPRMWAWVVAVLVSTGHWAFPLSDYRQSQLSYSHTIGSNSPKPVVRGRVIFPKYRGWRKDRFWWELRSALLLHCPVRDRQGQLFPGQVKGRVSSAWSLNVNVHDSYGPHDHMCYGHQQRPQLQQGHTRRHSCRQQLRPGYHHGPWW